jgi:hypothetical protein
MIDKKALREIILRREYKKLEEFNLRKIATSTISFLYSDEPEVFLFAEALGYVCGLIEQGGEVEFVRGILRRLFWHLSDESGAYCRGAPLGIGEIGRRCPLAFEGFKNMLVSLLENDEIEVEYVIYAIGVCGRSIKSAYPSPVEELKKFLRSDNLKVVAYAIVSLQRLGYDVSSELNLDLKNKVRIYRNGMMEEVMLSELLV